LTLGRRFPELIGRSGVFLYENDQGTPLMSPERASAEKSNRIKDPDDWVSGDEEMTGAQESYLKTLAGEAHENIEADLTKAEASKEIDRLRAKTGRGLRTVTKRESKASRQVS
jgi:Protein of unknown function (DUF3072)